MADKRIKVRVWMGGLIFTGEVTIPPMRKRLSDVLNTDDQLFINLTNVIVNEGGERVAFLSINKHRIDAISEL
jgi:hypothetical protein